MSVLRDRLATGPPSLSVDRSARSLVLVHASSQAKLNVSPSAVFALHSLCSYSTACIPLVPVEDPCAGACKPESSASQKVCAAALCPLDQSSIADLGNLSRPLARALRAAGVLSYCTNCVTHECTHSSQTHELAGSLDHGLGTHELTNSRTHERTNSRTHGLTNARTRGLTDSRTHELKN